MKLITKAIASALVDADKFFIDSADGEARDDVVVKFFTPWANATWFISSGTPLDAVNGEPFEGYAEEVTNGADFSGVKDWHLFGFCDLGDRRSAELGYVMLSEIESLKGPYGLKVERDSHFTGSLEAIAADYRGESSTRTGI